MTTRQIVARAAGVIVAAVLLGAGNVARANEQSGDRGPARSKVSGSPS